MKALSCIAVLVLSGGLFAVGARVHAGLGMVRVELPDGVVWTLGKGGVGRPFKARLLLINKGKETVTIWDHQNSEGSQSPGVVLTDEKGNERILRPEGIARAAGVPSVIAIPPDRVIVIELELLRLIGEQSPPAGKYRLNGFYENKLENDGTFIKSKVWLGRIESEPVEFTIVAPK